MLVRRRSFVKFKECDSLDVILEFDVGDDFETIVVVRKEPISANVIE